MELDLIIDKKQQIELEIQKLIQSYEKETGLIIKQVNMYRAAYQGSRGTDIDIRLEIHVGSS